MDRKLWLEKNVGSADRAVRVVLVAFLWMWALTAHLGTLATVVMAAIGGILLSTVISQYCPMWAMLGISTLKGRTPNQT